MVFDLDLSDTKWELLKHLEDGPMSPKELAESTGTSVANASQQLKLLEAQGYLKKVKNKGNKSRENRDARILYNLTKQKSWIITLGKEFVKRKELKNVDNFLLNLFLCDIKEIKPVMKFFLNHENLVEKIDCLYYLHTINNEIHFLIITDNLDFFRKENHSFESIHNDKKVLIKFWSHSLNEIKLGLEKNEEYFVDLIKQTSPIICGNNIIKKFLRNTDE